MNTFFLQMSSFYFLSMISSVSLLVYLWLNTDFAAHYIKLFKKFIPKAHYSWLMAEEYLVFYDDKISFNSYIEYLSFQKQGVSKEMVSFLLQLISCQICLTTWISALLAMSFSNLLLTGPVFLLISINIFFLKLMLHKK